MKKIDHPVFEVVVTKSGPASILNKELNEVMHSQEGPWHEANALYVEQSQLRKKLSITGEELVIFDVGLGAASNALAALVCAKELGAQSRALRVISFERDLGLLSFALEHSSRFPHFKGYEEILKTLLNDKRWSQDNISWELREGDFYDLIDHEKHKAHIIFFDPYSPKVNNDMWGAQVFKKLRAKSRESFEGGTVLYTYSRATRIRSALIKAGFYVGYGNPTGFKTETTEASTVYENLKSPVGQEWIDRYFRSDVRYPDDCDFKDRSNFDETICHYRDKLIQLNLFKK